MRGFLSWSRVLRVKPSAKDNLYLSVISLAFSSAIAWDL